MSSGWFDGSYATNPLDTPPAAAGAPLRGHHGRRWLYDARLPAARDRPAPAHDGDTIWLELDRGLDDRTTLALRLRNVAAPELDQPGGVECRQFVHEWLQDVALGGPWPFTVETFKTRGGRDLSTLGRYVAEVTMAYGTHESLNTAVQAYVTDNGWEGGTGA